MSKLDEAQQRLQRAVADLEAAARARPQAAAGGDGAVAHELETARRHAEELENRAAVVSERLDETIGRIKQILDD